MKALTILAFGALGLASVGGAAVPILPAVPAPIAQADDDPATDVDLEKLGDRMGVDVLVEGVGPFRFMVDSGASRTVVSRMLADRLGLPSEGQVDLHSMGGEARVDTVRITGLKLGGLETDPITAPVLEEANLGGAAILGIDALAGKRVVIDLAAGKMTIRGSTRRIERAAEGEIVVVAKRRHGQLILTNATIGGEDVDAVIDSGSDITIGNPALEARLSARRRAAATPVTLLDVTGRQTQARLTPLNEMKIGDLTLSNVPIAFTDAHAFHQFGLVTKPALLVGMDVLRAFRRVSIDFASRSIRFLVDRQGQTRLASAR